MPSPRARTTRLRRSGFGLYLDVPQLNGARSIVLATCRPGRGLEPFTIRLPHQVYLSTALDMLHRRYAVELWALPVGVEGRWVQLVGLRPGSTHPPLAVVSDGWYQP